jgi:hypothetical protein
MAEAEMAGEIAAETSIEPKTTKTKRKPRKNKARAAPATAPGGGARRRSPIPFPKHSISKCLRIPKAILEQNAGKECSDREGARFAGIGWTGEIGVEISSALKFGLLERPAPRTIKPTDLTRRIVRPQKPNDRRNAMQEAVLKAPVISDVYKHYRGENLPDDLSFLGNTARDTFGVPADRIEDFTSVFIEALTEGELVEDVNGKKRVLDITHMPSEVEGVPVVTTEEHLKKVGEGVSVDSSETCFVMMPFAEPLGGYYAAIYQPAIKKTGLTAVRADTDIFGTGKIIDQIWAGINRAKVLVAELTGRNPNVLYELGLAHALRKPVVLISSNEADVPFDVRHVRVIYYQMTDPFWGEKLIAKAAENILSAIKNPREAILFEKPTP